MKPFRLFSLALTLWATSGCSRRDPILSDPAPGTSARAPVASSSSAPTPAGLRCPSGRGPAMALLSGPAGAFCIDRTLVSKGQYGTFLAEVGSGEPRSLDKKFAPLSAFAQCLETNHSFGPHVDIDTSGSPSPPASARPDEVMTRVDVCDAFAYCRWAGKRLCGQPGGKPGSLSATASSATTPATSEWLWACTSGGTTRFPTGNDSKPGVCADASRPWAKETVAGHPDCRGQDPGFEQVQGMLSSVGSFTAECHPDSKGAPSLACALRGAFHPSRGACEVVATTGVNESNPESGIRCCADPVP